MSRYSVGNEEEGPILPNILSLTTIDQINQEEFVGFTLAAQNAIDELSEQTLFTLDYLYRLHRSALGHIYEFAGNLRTVNMSKDNFTFVSAQFLNHNLLKFEADFLDRINGTVWERDKDLRNILAEMHAELLYLHPFREGNGRVVRLFTRLIYLSKVGEELNFDVINEGGNFRRYITAVQEASTNSHFLMKELFGEM